jgi:hypothetical protein
MNSLYMLAILNIRSKKLIFISDGRLCRSGGHQVDHEAVRAHQQPLPFQYNDNDFTQLEDRIKVLFVQTKKIILILSKAI